MSRPRKLISATQSSDTESKNRLIQIARQLRIWADNLRCEWRRLPALPDPEADADMYQRLRTERLAMLSRQRRNADQLLQEARLLGAFSEGNQEFADAAEFTVLVYHWAPTAGVKLLPHPFGCEASGMGYAMADYLELLADQIQRTADEQRRESSPESKPIVVRRNDERDKWLNSEAEKGVPWNTIRFQLDRLADKNDWATLSSGKAVAMAVKAYRQIHGMPAIHHRKPGRPRNRK